MKKRVLSALLALTLVLGLLPAAAPHVHAEEHICVDNDFNHHCDDVGCRQYIDCYDSEVDDDDRCDLCSACLTPVDENEDNVCDFCGCCMAHTFENGYWYNEGGYHYPECDRCSYYNYADGARCADGDDNACCDVCGNCVDGEHSFAWDGENRDTVDHRIICSICGEEGWENHSDSEDEDSLCDVCGSCVDGYHGELVWDGTDRDNVTHRLVCEICGATYGWMDHTDTDSDGSCDVCRTCMNDSHSYHVWEEENRDTDMHRLVCNDCGLDSGWESHLDEDNDGSCDICGYEAHVHTYENGAYHMDSDYHYAMCDTCGHWDGLNCDSHTDADSNCLCDVCEYSLHQFDVLEDLENGTHQGVCTACGETVRQDHVFDQVDWDTEGHWYVCACGTAEAGGEKTAHVYETNNWYGHNGMHYPECDGCGYHQPEGEAHVDEDDNEECDVCQYWINAGVLPPLPDDNASKIIVLMADNFGDGWNGAAINIYENDVLAGTATVIFDEDDTASGYARVFEMPYDSATEYRFVWVEGSYDDECTYKIYVNGEEYTDDLDTEEGTSGGGGVEGGETPASGSVTITGNPVVGQILTAVASGFDSGKALTYQWYRVVEIRVPIDGATAPTYTLTEADLHWAIYFVVNGVESNHVGAVTLPTYDLWIGNDITGGTITADKTCAAEGETVTLTIAPDAGYQLKSIRINDAENKTVIGKTTVTFTMPAENVNISATFAEGVVVYFNNTVSDWTNVLYADGNGYSTCIDLDNDLYGMIVPAGKTMSFTNYMPGMPEAEYPEGYSTTVEFIPENGTTYSVETLRTIHMKTEGDQLTVSDSSAEAGSPTDMILMIAGYHNNRQMVDCQVIEDVTGVTEETLTVTGDYIKVFFLKPGTYAPLFQSLVL